MRHRISEQKTIITKLVMMATGSPEAQGFGLLSLFPVTRAEDQERKEEEEEEEAKPSTNQTSRSSTPCRDDDHDEEDLSLALTLGLPPPPRRLSSSIKKRKSVDYVESPYREEVNSSVNLVNEVKDPWEIKKKLTTSDIGNLCRLLVPKKAVEMHILPHWDEEAVGRVKSRSGLGVRVRDCDANTTHELVFKYLDSSESYVINYGWRSKFVVERKLKLNDEIGLYWDARSSMFMFSVLDDQPAVQLGL